MKASYIDQVAQIVDDPNIAVNVISKRVKQLKNGAKPFVESLERLSAEDIALREVIEGKITYELKA